MGCRTGCYAVFKGDLGPRDVLPVLKELFGFIAGYSRKIPGASARQCGNYLSQDLPLASLEAGKYLKEVLLKPSPGNLTYPAKPKKNG